MHCGTSGPADRFADSWSMLEQGCQNATIQDKKTFLVSLQLFFFFIFQTVFNDAARLRKSHMLPNADIYRAAAASQESSTLTYWIVEELSTGWMTVLLPLPFLTFALVDADLQLSLDAPFLGPVQGRYVPALMTPGHRLSCFSTMKWSERWQRRHITDIFLECYFPKDYYVIHARERGKKSWFDLNPVS